MKLRHSTTLVAMLSWWLFLLAPGSGADSGSRHIRRITAADLPNPTQAIKTVSFPADDILQGRLHVTTTQAYEATTPRTTQIEDLQHIEEYNTSSNHSVVFNETRNGTSIKKDFVTENTTREVYEKFSIETKVYSETPDDIESTTAGRILPNSTSRGGRMLVSRHYNGTLASQVQAGSSENSLVLTDPPKTPKIKLVTRQENFNATEEYTKMSEKTEPSVADSETSKKPKSKHGEGLEKLKIFAGNSTVLEQFNVTKKPKIKPPFRRDSHNRTEEQIFMNNTTLPESNEEGNITKYKDSTKTSTLSLLQNNEQAGFSNSTTAVPEKSSVVTTREAELEKTEGDSFNASDAQTSKWSSPLSLEGLNKTEENPSTQEYFNSTEEQTTAEETTFFDGSGFTTESVSRGRAFTFETPTTRTENLRRKVTTMRRRPYTTTEPIYTVIATSNSTTESNTIFRGWLGSTRRTKLGNGTDNNEGNDIVTSYKPLVRNRGTVRYSTTAAPTTSVRSWNDSSLFPIPPTSAAWTLVTLRGPGNDTNSTRTKPSPGKWSATSTQSQNTSTRPLPESEGKPSSTQENRLSSVQVLAPSTVIPTNEETTESSTTTASSSEEDNLTSTVTEQTTSAELITESNESTTPGLESTTGYNEDTTTAATTTVDPLTTTFGPVEWFQGLTTMAVLEEEVEQPQPEVEDGENKPGQEESGLEAPADIPADVEDSKNSYGNRQLYESQNTASALDEEHSEESSEVPQGSTLTPPPADEQTSTVPVTTTTVFTTTVTETDRVTTWSSTSSIEWDLSDATTQPSVYGPPVHLILTLQTSWKHFCPNITSFKKQVSSLLTENPSLPVSDNQVEMVNAEICSHGDAETSSPIRVEMLLVDKEAMYSPELTIKFLKLWSNGGLQTLLFPISDVQSAPQVDSTDAASEEHNGGAGMIAAIAISCIGAVCLLLLAVLWIVMRKRQQKFNYGQRCTPVSLDAYSLDSVSVCGSVRRKGIIRSSKRSYGNAGFDDPNTPSHPMGFAGLANFVLNREQIEEEFSNIPQVTANVDELPEGADTKNRYSNVIPLPETRVQLTPIEGEPHSDYINANYVHGPKNTSKYYIACQAPLPSTVTDFWRMVWEQQSKVILMLTDLVENGVEKCADYLPPSEVLDCHRLFGDFQITLKKREVKEKYIISTLQLKNLETNSWREVTHLWYVSWPAQGVPDDLSSVIAFLLEARPYMKGGPCVVHCSPGTGRTGTVIACDLCIRDFETARIVDIPRCVARIRRDRAGAVQTRDQYVFIYQVINLYGAKLTGGALDSM